MSKEGWNRSGYRVELVGKRELLARVWSRSVVEECNLKVAIAAARRAIGDGRDGRRYLVNVCGQGDQFVEPVRCLEEPSRAVLRESDGPCSSACLARQLEMVRALVETLQSGRQVTLGPSTAMQGDGLVRFVDVARLVNAGKQAGEASPTAGSVVPWLTLGGAASTAPFFAMLGQWNLVAGRPRP